MKTRSRVLLFLAIALIVSVSSCNKDNVKPPETQISYSVNSENVSFTGGYLRMNDEMIGAAMFKLVSTGTGLEANYEITTISGPNKQIIIDIPASKFVVGTQTLTYDINSAFQSGSVRIFHKGMVYLNWLPNTSFQINITSTSPDDVSLDISGVLPEQTTKEPGQISGSFKHLKLYQ